MFCYQKNFSNPTLPVDEAQFWALVRATQWNENIDKYRETHDAALKRKLPAFIFQATFDETLSKAGKLGRWRKQAATRLTGLVVMDIDGLPRPLQKEGSLMHLTPLEIFQRWREEHPELFADAKHPLSLEGDGGRLLLVYITPSGEGLKIVFKARAEWGNLIDNQHEMAKVLGVEVDESCKDASRMSFICKESDILFIDKELFTYENKEFAERYDALYRDGRSQGKNTNYTNLTNNNEKSNETGSPLPLEGEGGGLYHGVEYAKICEAWQAAQGGAPAAGDRHRTMLQMALDLRYICDNQPEVVDRVLRLCGFVQDIIRDCADLCRTSSESEGTKKSQTLLIRLVSESCTKTSPRGCKGCLKVWVFMEATPQQLQSLWEQLKCLTNSSLKGWNLSFAPLMPKPVEV